MGFKENIRAEQKHFLNLKTLVSLLSRWASDEKDAKTVDILNSCIEADKTLILLYKNLGEIWNELAGAIVAEKARLEALRSEVSEFKDEVNGKIDEVNNYLLSLIRDLETRVEILEKLDRIKIYTMRYVSNQRIIYDGNERATASEMLERLNNGYNVFVYYVSTSDVVIFNVYSTTPTTLYFICTRMYANKDVVIRRFTFSGNSVTEYVTQTFNPENMSNSITNLNNSFTILNGRIGDAELDIVGVKATLDEAQPYQIQIVLPTTGWTTWGTLAHYRAPETVDLTNAAMITLTAGASDLSDYDALFDASLRAKEINLFGCFDDNGGEPAQSCFQFYADSVPTDPIRVLVTVSPYINNSTAVSTVVNGIY